MHRWSYLVARWVGEDEPRVREANGKELANWEEGTLFTFLDSAGQEGWELVGTMNRGAMPYGYLVFKRPASAGETG